MTDEKIIALARAVRDGGHWNQLDIINFARLVAVAAQAESEPSATEQVARWMIAHGYATGHGDSLGDLLHHLRWQVRDETLHGRLNRD